jgi:hypothetical protein
MQLTPYLHPQRLRFVLALQVHAGRARRHPLPLPGRREKPACLLNNATKALELGLDVDALPEAVQAQHVLVQHIEDYTPAHFWAAVLSLEPVHRLGAIREAERVLGGLVQVVCVEGAEAGRIKRQVERVGRERWRGRRRRRWCRRRCRS